MAEAAGISIGAVGLAGLFSACLDCFNLVQAGRSYSQDLALVSTKYEVEKMRLLIWGEAAGIQDGRSRYGNNLDKPHVKKLVEDIMLQLNLLLDDSSALEKRYGLQARLIAEGPSNEVARPGTLQDTFEIRFAKLKISISTRQKKAKIQEKVKWAIRDKDCFQGLVDDARQLIDGLYAMTKDLRPETQRMVEEDISVVTDADDIRLLHEILTDSETSQSGWYETASQCFGNPHYTESRAHAVEDWIHDTYDTEGGDIGTDDSASSDSDGSSRSILQIPKVTPIGSSEGAYISPADTSLWRTVPDNTELWNIQDFTPPQTIKAAEILVKPIDWSLAISSKASFIPTLHIDVPATGTPFFRFLCPPTETSLTSCLSCCRLLCWQSSQKTCLFSSFRDDMINVKLPSVAVERTAIPVVDIRAASKMMDDTWCFYQLANWSGPEEYLASSIGHAQDSSSFQEEENAKFGHAKFGRGLSIRLAVTRDYDREALESNGATFVVSADLAGGPSNWRPLHGRLSDAIAALDLTFMKPDGYLADSKALWTIDAYFGIDPK